MNDIERLTELFTSFPGVGPRQAKRFVYYLLRKNSGFSNELAALIPRITQATKKCDSCHRFFVPKNNEQLCSLCSNENRDISKLLLVAQDSDLEAIEKAGLYNGFYFVLGGYIPLLEKAPNTFIRINELQALLSSREVQEIIFAFSTTPDSEHTVEFISDLVTEKYPGISLTTLGRGLSTGAEIEYADKDTLKHALENRK